MSRSEVFCIPLLQGRGSRLKKNDLIDIVTPAIKPITEPIKIVAQQWFSLSSLLMLSM